MCDERNDEQSSSVRLRIQGSCSDLHAAEARYHDKCRKLFMSKPNIQTVRNQCHLDTSENKALSTVMKTIRNDSNRAWSSVQIHRQYTENKGASMTRRTLMNKIEEELKDEIIILSSPGVANILILKCKASSMFSIDAVDDDDDIHVKALAKKIVSEVKNIPYDKSKYKTSIGIDTVFEDVSHTLASLLSNISSSLNRTLPAAMVGNIITSCVSKRYTTLQIGLGLLARDKKLIQHLHEYSVTSTYDEVRQFKVSAAAASDKTSVKSIFYDPAKGLIQTVAYNFDQPYPHKMVCVKHIH